MPDPLRPISEYNFNPDFYTVRETGDSRDFAPPPFVADSEESTAYLWDNLANMNQTAAIEFKADLREGAAGCVSAPKSCLKTGGIPSEPTVVGPIPGGLYDYNDPDRPTITYRIEGIADCDGTTDGLDIQTNYGTVETAEDGSNAIVAYRFDERPDHITLTITGKNGGKREVFLYPPLPTSTIPGQCDYSPAPILTGDIEYPDEVFAGQEITISYPKNMILLCDQQTVATENDINVHFAINNENYPAYSNGDNYYYPVTFATPGDKTVTMFVTSLSGDITVTKQVNFYVKDPSGSADKPSATIGNLTYAYHVGDTETNIICNSDDPNATFAWTVTRPGPNGNGDTIESFAGDEIPSYYFDLEGDYDFECVVTAGDGVTTNNEIRSVTVYPASTPIPILSIMAPTSAPANTDVNFQVGVPETNLFRYYFNFGDSPTWYEGTNINKSYSQTGVFEVHLRAELLSNPSVVFNLNAPHNITIY
jgi:hypothetical protein